MTLDWLPSWRAPLSQYHCLPVPHDDVACVRRDLPGDLIVEVLRTSDAPALAIVLFVFRHVDCP